MKATKHIKTLIYSNERLKPVFLSHLILWCLVLNYNIETQLIINNTSHNLYPTDIYASEYVHASPITTNLAYLITLHFDPSANTMDSSRRNRRSLRGDKLVRAVIRKLQTMADSDDTTKVGDKHPPEQPSEQLRDTLDGRLAGMEVEGDNVDGNTEAIHGFGRISKKWTPDLETVITKMQESPNLTPVQKVNVVATLSARKAIVFLDNASDNPKYQQLATEVKQIKIMEAIEQIPHIDSFISLEAQPQPPRLILTMTLQTTLFLNLFVEFKDQRPINIRPMALLEQPIFHSGIRCYLFQAHLDPIKGFTNEWILANIIKKAPTSFDDKRAICIHLHGVHPGTQHRYSHQEVAGAFTPALNIQVNRKKGDTAPAVNHRKSIRFARIDFDPRQEEGTSSRQIESTAASGVDYWFTHDSWVHMIQTNLNNSDFQWTGLAFNTISITIVTDNKEEKQAFPFTVDLVPVEITDANGDTVTTQICPRNTCFRIGCSPAKSTCKSRADEDPGIAKQIAQRRKRQAQQVDKEEKNKKFAIKLKSKSPASFG